MRKIDIKKIVSISLLWSLLPIMASAATVQSILDNIKGTLNFVIGLLFVLVTLYFILGIVQYVTAAGDETKLGKGKKHMIWGIIGMAVMAGAWGIVNIITTYFGVGGTNTVTPPQINF